MRNGKTRVQWSRLVAEWRRSGLSTRAFAEQRGLSAKSLAWWRWRLAADEVADEEVPEAPRLVSVDMEEDARTESPVWELTTAAGHVLRVHGAIEPQMLARVLATITRRSR